MIRQTWEQKWIGLRNRLSKLGVYKKLRERGKDNPPIPVSRADLKLLLEILSHHIRSKGR